MAEFSVLSLRLHVPAASSSVMLEGEPGIICVGMTGSDDSPPLVVIWDESPEGRNDGCSATNCIARVLAFLKKRWVGQFETDEALVVERDSDGAFDHVAPAWPDSPDANQPHHVDWRPVTKNLPKPTQR